MTDFKTAAKKVLQAINTPTDDLAARLGEDNSLVKIKRNSDQLAGCGCHEFNPVPDWRVDAVVSRVRATCKHCGGEMKMGDISNYLLGKAHATGADYDALMAEVFPPETGGRE